MLQARGSRVLGTIALALITVVWQSSHVSAESPTGWQGPIGWWSGDIGTIGGSAVENGDTFEITADGHNIGGTSDSFHFMFKELGGDGSITARVVSNGTGNDTWAKGGVMIRDDISPGSTYGMTVVTGGAGGGAAFEWRMRPDRTAGSAHGPTPNVSPPCWVRIEKTGRDFSSYLSSDGRAWRQHGVTKRIAVSDPVYIGLCASSCDLGYLRTYTFDNVSYEGHVVDRPLNLVASRPSPSDGAVCTNTWINLSWVPGDLATSHNVYFSSEQDAVVQRRSSALIATPASPSTSVGSPGGPFPHGLQTGTTYYWCVDEVSDAHPDSLWESQVWSFGISAELAVYLLITNEKLAPAFQPLVDRRTMQGFPGRLSTVENIYAAYLGADEQEQIRNCIRDHYINHGTLYVALGGDDTIVPVRYCYTGIREDIQPADLYYSDMDGGDWDEDGDRRHGEPGDVGEAELIPEVHLGRIPMRTIDDTIAYVNKVMTYESATPESYAGSVFLAGGGGSPHLCAEERPLGFQDHDPVAHFEVGVTSWYVNSVQPYWQGVPVHRHFPTHSSWDQSRCGDAEWSPQALATHLNKGYHLVLYGGHGAPTAWGMGGQFFRSTQAAQLTNPFPSVIVSVGCSVAAFDWGEPSLSEGFLRNPNGGAIAFFGFTRSGASGKSRTELSSELFRDRHTSIGEAMTRSQSTMAPKLVGAPWRICQFTFQGDPLIHLIPEREGRHLQVLQPKGLENIQRDSDIYVRWNAAGTGFGPDEFVKLEYSTDSGRTWDTVPQAEALPYNARVFIWDDCSLPPGTKYRIRVVSSSDPDVSDMSNRDFTIGDLGLLAVRSAHTPSILIEGLYGNWTGYDISVLKGEVVTLRTPEVGGPPVGTPFVRWSDGAGRTLSYSPEYTFTFVDDAVVVAEYGNPTATYYVNDEISEDGVAAGNDDNDGRTPGTPVRRIQTLLERHPEFGWGDIIRVSPGTYYENVVLDANITGLTLAGAGRELTTIDAQQSGSCLSMSGVGYAHISGFTFTNGAAANGGGLMSFGSSLDVEDCAFVGNVTSGAGGSMFIDACPDVQITDCVFNRNSADGRGGAMFCNNAKVSITQTRFEQNTAGSGGAITNRYDTYMTVDDSVFLGNTAHDGGAVCNWASPSTEMTSCLFEANQAGRYGGASFTNGAGSEQVFQNCIFSGNKGRGGGAIATAGNGAYATVANCTFSGNSATWKGGALYVTDDQSTTLAGSILWGNTPTEIVGGPFVSYCDVRGGWEGEGNINVDPLFADPTTGDYHLTSQAGPANMKKSCRKSVTTSDKSFNGRET